MVQWHSLLSLTLKCESAFQLLLLLAAAPPERLGAQSSWRVGKGQSLARCPGRRHQKYIKLLGWLFLDKAAAAAQHSEVMCVTLLWCSHQ